MSFYESKIFPWVLKVADRAFRRDRAEVLGQAHGRVLEIGVGTGTSLPYYADTAEEIVGIEPSGHLLQHSHNVARSIPGLHDKVILQEGDAHALAFESNSFDSVVAFLVFCTIPDANRAAAEVFRVLKPGGSLLFFEHVRAPSKKLSAWQDRVNPLWKKVGCGCHLNRSTKEVFQKAGFEFERIEEFYHPKIIKLVSPVIKGVAKKPNI